MPLPKNSNANSAFGCCSICFICHCHWLIPFDYNVVLLFCFMFATIFAVSRNQLINLPHMESCRPQIAENSESSCSPLSFINLGKILSHIVRKAAVSMVKMQQLRWFLQRQLFQLNNNFRLNQQWKKFFNFNYFLFYLVLIIYI